MRRLIAALFLALAPLAAAAEDLAEDMLRLGVNVDGDQREFLFYVPQSLRAFSGPRPLVLVMHGVLSTDEKVFEKTLTSFNLLAERHGFVVAYPKAVLRAWDLGEGIASSLLPKRRDDIAFLKKVIAAIDGMIQIDRNRIYATGFSLGGQMSYALACKNPGLIRAVMTVSMSLPDFLVDDCQFGPPLSVLMIHGTEDHWVPFQGGTFPVGPRERDWYLSHERTVEIFRQRDGCNPALYFTELIDNLDDDTRVTRREWRQCDNSAVVSYVIEGGGHAWPREEQSLEARILGRATMEFDAADEAWTFFESLDSR